MNNRQIIFFILSIFLISSKVIADNYPKTSAERKADEIGSILGGEGLTFSPKKIKNESTKSGAQITNKYLWQAAIAVINFVPLQSVDSGGGIIITEWYSPKGKPTSSFKINIFIKGNVISPDALEVRVFEKVVKDKDSASLKPSGLGMILADKILRSARELYIQETRK